MTWRRLAGRCGIGFAVGNAVGFFGMAITDALAFRVHHQRKKVRP